MLDQRLFAASKDVAEGKVAGEELMIQNAVPIEPTVMALNTYERKFEPNDRLAAAAAFFCLDLMKTERLANQARRES